jgi:uncharacterized protein (DUF433 family)
VTTRARGIRLPEQLDSELESERRFRGGTSFSQLATSLLTEAIRMRRVPGVIFVDGLDSRRAAVAGTGLEVWELIATYRAVGENAEELGSSYPQLSESQLRSALAYYELYPEEIEARLEREESWTPEEMWNRYPFTRPGAVDGRGSNPDGSV